MASNKITSTISGTGGSVNIASGCNASGVGGVSSHVVIPGGSVIWHPGSTAVRNPIYYYGPGDPCLPVEPQKEEAKIVPQHPKAIKIKLPDGSTAMECVRCERQTQYAESNQENGSFICYECRNGI